MQLAAHLAFDGNCRQAFEFYADTLGGRILMQLTYGDAPDGAGSSAEMSDKIMHARLDIEGQYLMGADAPRGRYQASRGIMLSISISEVERARQIFDALAGGGNVTMPFQETFWARGFGMCIDRFAVPWMVNCEKPMPLGVPALAGSARGATARS